MPQFYLIKWLFSGLVAPHCVISSVHSVKNLKEMLVLIDIHSSNKNIRFRLEPCYTPRECRIKQGNMKDLLGNFEKSFIPFPIKYFTITIKRQILVYNLLIAMSTAILILRKIYKVISLGYYHTLT